MKKLDRSVLDEHHVAVGGDAAWQQRLRLLQALWREERQLPIGEHHGAGDSRPLGSRLAMPEAKERLSNYLTDTIRDVVREVIDDPATAEEGRLFSAPRIYNDLLSSQPLCFNLFGELKADLDLATTVCRHLWPERVKQITRIDFEYSPARGDAAYTGNRTAFDVYMEHTHPAGGRGFTGIEVKYHENLRVSPAENRDRTDEVAAVSGIFESDRMDDLRQPPLQQIWFDHLLALSMLQADDWTDGLFVFLHPAANQRCYEVVGAYEQTLVDADTFQRMSLEEFVAALGLATSDDWVAQLHRRYLDYSRADDATALPGRGQA